MSYDVDSGIVLYALGVLFGLAALVYFLPDVVFGLSITVRAALLLFAFLAFLVGGFALERDVLDQVSFALAAAAYVVFVWYVVTRYELGETGTFLLLAASAALFVGLGFATRERDVAVPRRTALAVVGALLAVALVLVVADAVAGGVAYELQLRETATAEEPLERPPNEERLVPAETQVGTVTATNQFAFREPLDLPRLGGCLAGVDGAGRDFVHVGYDRGHDRSEAIASRSETTVPIEATVPVRANASEPREYAIERGTDCDVEREAPTLIVLVGEDAVRPR